MRVVSPLFAPRVVAGDRVTIIGQSGSGKTTLLRYLVEARPTSHVVIIDTKGEDVLKGDVYETHCDAEEILLWTRETEAGVWVCRPSVQELFDPASLDESLLELSQTAKNLSLVIDEVYQVQLNTRAGPGLLSWLTRGRSFGLTTYIGAQRPVGVSRFVWSEASQVGLLRLSHEDDRRFVAKSFGLPEFQIAPLPRFEVFWYQQNTGNKEIFSIQKPNR